MTPCDTVTTQGYAQLVTPSRLPKIKELLGSPTAHIEKAKGSPQQAWDYCTKEETRIEGPWCTGLRPGGAGTRTDIVGAVDLLKEGKRLAQVLEEYPSVVVKYFRGLQACQMLLAKSRDPANSPVIEVFWGESGTGKTRKAVSENPDAYLLTKPNGNGTLWFDGYEGQTCVILDEFYGWIQYDLLLRLLDRYPLRVQTKGGTVEMCATKFVITSNKSWRDWYPNIDKLDALERRIREFGKVTHFNRM